MAKLFANSEDPDQMPRSVASDLGLHCLPVTLLRVSQLQWVNSFLYKERSVQHLHIDIQSDPLVELFTFITLWDNSADDTFFFFFFFGKQVLTYNANCLL